MILIKLTYLFLKSFYDSIGSLLRIKKLEHHKAKFDSKCFSYIGLLQNLNDNDFIRAIRPLFIGLVIFGLAEFYLAAKLFGEHHFIVRKMIIVILSLISITSIGLVSDERVISLKEQFKEFIEKWVDFVFKWLPRIGAFVFAIWATLKMLMGEKINLEDSISSVNNIEISFVIVFIGVLFLPIVPYLFVSIQILFVRIGLVKFLRMLVNRTLKKGNTNPFLIVTQFVSLLLIVELFFVIKEMLIVI